MDAGNKIHEKSKYKMTEYHHNSSWEELKDGKIRLNIYCYGEMIVHDFPNIGALEKYYNTATKERRCDVV